MERNSETVIRQRAYEIWLEEGSPDGRAAEHWEKARAEYAAASARADGPTLPKTAPSNTQRPASARKPKPPKTAKS